MCLQVCKTCLPKLHQSDSPKVELTLMRDINCPLNPHTLDRRLRLLIPSEATTLTMWPNNLDNFEQTLQSLLDINLS